MSLKIKTPTIPFDSVPLRTSPIEPRKKGGKNLSYKDGIPALFLTAKKGKPRRYLIH